MSLSTPLGRTVLTLSLSIPVMRFLCSVAGTVFVHKVAGAAADAGCTLEQASPVSSYITRMLVSQASLSFVHVLCLFVGSELSNTLANSASQ
jgi:hypothetical protein